jgi:transcriptional accessory protein Tex/SPT6
VAEASDTTATTEASEPESSVEEAASSEEAGATFTPVAAQETRPRRLKDLEVGMELEGRVTSVALYGIFVDIGVGRDGLVHISEMSDTRIDSPSDIVQIGDTVKVRIKSIDLDARRISLTMRSRRERDSGGGGSRGGSRKRAEIDRDALSNLKNGDTVDGTITGLAPFGAFVDIGVGKDGLVHISELSDSRVERPEDAVQVGDQYTFKLLDVDSEGNRISLSLRRAQRAQKLQKLEPGQILDGRVSGLAPFGAFVDIGVGRDGLVHISQLSEGRVEKVEDAVNVGDSVSVRVLEVDPQSKRISLSMRLEEPEEEPELEPQTPEINYGIYQTPRDDSRKDRRRGRSRSNTPQPPVEVYVSEDDSDEEEIEGDATLEDLVMKFNSNRRDRRRRSSLDEDDEENYGKRQRDAQRRTLRQLDDEDE